MWVLSFFYQDDSDVYILTKVSDILHSIFSSHKEKVLPWFERLLSLIVNLIVSTLLSLNFTLFFFWCGTEEAFSAGMLENLVGRMWQLAFCKIEAAEGLFWIKYEVVMLFWTAALLLQCNLIKARLDEQPRLVECVARPRIMDTHNYFEKFNMPECVQYSLKWISGRVPKKCCRLLGKIETEIGISKCQIDVKDLP